MPLFLVQESRILLEFSGSIYTVFLRIILDLCYVMCMLGCIFAVAISPEAVDAAKRVLEKKPFFLFALHVSGIVALNVSKTVAIFPFYPYIIVGWQDIATYSLCDDGILHRNRIYVSSLQQGELHRLLGISCPVPEIGLAHHLTVFHRVIGEEFRRVVGYGLHLRLPGKEIRLQEVVGRIGESIHSGTDYTEINDLCL